MREGPLWAWFGPLFLCYVVLLYKRRPSADALFAAVARSSAFRQCSDETP